MGTAALKQMRGYKLAELQTAQDIYLYEAKDNPGVYYHPTGIGMITPTLAKEIYSQSNIILVPSKEIQYARTYTEEPQEAIGGAALTKILWIVTIGIVAMTFLVMSNL